jgi:rare lipoprotein A
MRKILVAVSIMAIAQICLKPDQTRAADGSSGQLGIASIYSTNSGSRTASGKKLNPAALTAAHRTLPFGTNVRVMNTRNGRSVIVTINDRGPFVRGRVIDVTPAAAHALGFSGLTRVVLKISPDSESSKALGGADPIAAPVAAGADAAATGIQGQAAAQRLTQGGP